MTDPLLALQSIRRFHSDEASRARFNNMPAAVRMHEHLLGRVDLVIAALATPAPAQPEGAQEDEPVAWESTTICYRKFISQRRYEAFSPKVRSWYKPYRCSACAEAGAAAPVEGAPTGWQLAPIQPTKEMVDAGSKHTSRDDDEEPYRARGEAIAVYMDMLAAAPKEKPHG